MTDSNTNSNIATAVGELVHLIMELSFKITDEYRDFLKKKYGNNETDYFDKYFAIFSELNLYYLFMTSLIGINELKIESQVQAYLESLQTEVANLNANLFCSNFEGLNLSVFRARLVEQFYDNYDITKKAYAVGVKEPDYIRTVFSLVTKNILGRIDETDNKELAKSTFMTLSENLPVDKIVQVVTKI